MRKIKLIDNIEYGHKYLTYKKDDGSINYKDGDSFICDNISLEKEVYYADELVYINKEKSKVVDSVVNNFIKTFESRNIKPTDEQINFARETSKVIVGDLKDNIVTIIPAPCGFGKSTIKIEIIKFYIDLYKKGLTSNGMIISADRLDDLREIQDTLNNDKSYTYLLEGKNEEVCIMKSDIQCHKCNNSNCKVKTQLFEQKKYPILLVTNARLKECSETFNRYKDYDDGIRTLLLIDEKPQIKDTTKINQKLLDEINTYISSLDYEDINDKTLLQQQWNDIDRLINEKFISLRNNGYKRFIISNNSNIGVCRDNKIFMDLWNKYMKNNYKRELQHIHDVLTKGGFYVYEKNTEFIARIGYRNLQEEYCNDFKTIIFDGSALYDPDYNILINNNYAKFLYVENTRLYDNLKIDIYNAHKITKTQLHDKKYLIKAVGNFINNKIKDGFGSSYVVCNQEESGRLSEILNSTLKRDIPLNDDGRCFYFGATKGSNAMQKCTRMFQVGWDRMPDYEYVIEFLCCNFDWNKILELCLNQEKAIWFSSLLTKTNREETFRDKSYTSNNYSFGIPKINECEYLDILCKFYQEVHRTKLREYSYNGRIQITLFRSEFIIYSMIKQLFPKCELTEINTEQIEFKVEKKNSYTKADGNKTDVQRVIEWIDNNKEFKVSDLRKECNLSSKRWERIKSDDVIKSKLNKYDTVKRGYYILKK